MTQASGAIARAMHDAFNRGDLEAFVAGCAPDIEYHPALERRLEQPGGAYRGHDGIREWWQRMTETWADLHSELQEVRDLGSRVVVLGTLRARGRASDITVDAEIGQVITICGGRVVTSHDFLSHGEALHAAGLRE